MKVAVIPLDTEYYSKNGLLTGTSSIAHLLSYLELKFPDDIFYPANDFSLLLKTRPDIVGISAPYSQEFNKLIELSKAIKEQLKVPVVLGGQHISQLPKSLPLSVDAGVIGEGEESFRDLVSLYRENNFSSDINYMSVPGIVFHHKGQKYISEKRKSVSNIDSLEMTRKYFFEMPGNWLPNIVSGRGNLYKNIFSSPEPEIRLHSAERIIGDFIDIITYFPETKFVPIYDSLFLYDRKRLERFADIVEETGLTKYLRFGIFALPQQLSPDILDILKYRLNIQSLTIAFSSPSVRLQKDLKTFITEPKEQLKILENCYKLGINTKYYYTLGSTTETKEEISRSYWFLRDYCVKRYNNLIEIEAGIPYPGSEAWSRAIVKKLLNDNYRDWQNLNPESINLNTPLISPLGQKEDFIQIINKFRELIPAPNTSLPMLDGISGLKNKLSQSVEEYLRENYPDFDQKDFYKLASDNLKRQEFYKKPEAKENLNLSLFETIEQLLVKDKFESIDQIEDEINKILGFYYHLNQSKDIIPYLQSREIISLAAMNIMEALVKNNKIENILVVSHSSIVDLSRILNSYQLDYLNPKKFNFANPGLSSEKEYDCIILPFSADMTSHPERMLDYCHKSLKRDGILILSFFNVRNVLHLTQLITNRDLNKLFYSFNKLSIFSYQTMTDLLKKEYFIPVKASPSLLPPLTSISLPQTFLYSLLKLNFNISDSEFSTIAYTLVCRKIKKR